MGARIVKAGQLLDGRFRLVEEIGQGGMSTIFKAEDVANGGEPVVVKVPLPVFSSGIGGWSLFQQEEEIGRRLDHPHVLRFIPLAVDKRRSYVVTEYVPGRTLADHLRDEGVLPEPEALAICRQICDALEYLHRSGVVHYDLKPGNVMLCPDGGIRLIDFGLAHAVEESRFSLTGAPPAIGSSGYIAPEQVRRKRGRRSVDIYALGAVLYEMLTGKPPFGDDDPFGVASARLIGDPEAPRRLNPQVSREAEEIVLRALRRDPAERYQSASELRAALEHPERVVVSGLSERLLPPTPARRRWKLARHVATVAVLPVITQVLLFFAIWHHLASKR
ncbi:MAG TPA: serine/threonine-protein kinase [Polyangia bacterium]|nr:serine/threonine-protein kinase [Polyangia bacterium]